MKVYLISSPAYKFYSGELELSAEELYNALDLDNNPDRDMYRYSYMLYMQDFSGLRTALREFRDTNVKDFVYVLEGMDTMLKGHILSLKTLKDLGYSEETAQHIKSAGQYEYREFVKRYPGKMPNGIYEVAFRIHEIVEHRLGNDTQRVYCIAAHKFYGIIKNAPDDSLVLYKDGRLTRLMTRKQYLDLKDVLVYPVYETGMFKVIEKDEVETINHIADALGLDRVSCTEHMSADRNLEEAEKYLHGSEGLRYAGNAESDKELALRFAEESDLPEDIEYAERYSWLKEQNDVIENKSFHDNVKRHLQKDGKLSYIDYIFEVNKKNAVVAYHHYIEEMGLEKAKELGLIPKESMMCTCGVIIKAAVSSDPDDTFTCPHCGTEHACVYKPEEVSYDELAYCLTNEGDDPGIYDESAELQDWEQDDLRTDQPQKAVRLYSDSPESIVLKGTYNEARAYIRDLKNLYEDVLYMDEDETEKFLSDAGNRKAYENAKRILNK